MLSNHCNVLSPSAPPNTVSPPPSAVVFEGVVTEPSPTFLSSILKVAVSMVVVVPLTVRLPLKVASTAVTFPDAVTFPVAARLPVTLAPRGYCLNLYIASVFESTGITNSS